METSNSVNVSAAASSLLTYPVNMFKDLRRRLGRGGAPDFHHEQEASPSNVSATPTNEEAASRMNRQINFQQQHSNNNRNNKNQQLSQSNDENDSEISSQHFQKRHSRHHASISSLHSSEREDDSASTTDGTMSDRMGLSELETENFDPQDDNHSQSLICEDQDEAFMEDQFFMSSPSQQQQQRYQPRECMNSVESDEDDDDDDGTILFTNNQNCYQDDDIPTPLNLSPIKPCDSSSKQEKKHPMASPLLQQQQRRSSVSSSTFSSFVTNKRKPMAATPGGRLSSKTSSTSHLNNLSITNTANTTTNSPHIPTATVDQHSPRPHQYSFLYHHGDHMQRFRHTRYQTGQLPESGPYRFDDSREIRNKLSLTNTSDIQNVGQYEFNAVRLTTCDWFINGWQKTSTHMIRVQIDIYKKRITFCYLNMDEQTVQEKLVIAFDDITGLEFQHSPLSDDIVVIEVNQIPSDAPASMRSNFFFLYLTKEDSAKYMDGALLSSDKRLLKLAIVGLPTWATIVNRYSIPIFYNHRIRGVITTLVNIYIIISLIWGFYDLYKNLPIVGGALRAIFGPVASFLEPIIKNKIMLLIPLVFSKVWEAAQIFFSLFAPLLSVFTPLWKLIVTLSNAITNVFKPLADGFVILVNGLIYPFIQLYHHVLYPLFNGLYLLFAGISRFLSLIGTGIYTAFKIPVQFVGVVSAEIVDMFVDLFYALSTALSYPVTFFKLLFSLIAGIIAFIYSAIVYPFTKLGTLFKFKKDIEHATKVVSNVAAASSQAASTTSSLKDYLMSMKENFQPLSSLWNGIRRIIDSIIHTYHTKIKHRSVWKRRILITIICLIVFAGLVIVFALLT
ncbi:hypothetical protein C9374_009316 [Naegleria lovaniensis]|uniref:Uncharacterized protein n=1 Tax=Naegleria lovaniensis TaxID=51637 RepID=A0AA88GIG6_NAELO|nr:uncharacterized protein C9374_009316 [Naegleria lovaniensis]KAG2377405.1 hypothetical protein C9374_009316 [Naegleria lovaniensis]